MATRASNRKADGGAAESGSKTFDLAAYSLAVANANSAAADAVKGLENYRRQLEDEVIFAMGGEPAKDVFRTPQVTTSYANAKLMATRAAEATAYLAQLTAPSEDFSESIRKAHHDASLALGQLDVERQLRAAELDRHRKLWERRLTEELEGERGARSSVLQELEKERGELALSKKRVEDLEGRNVMCMDAEALVELREVLENSLGHVNRREERVACLPDVLGIMPEAACQITKKCMIFPVLAADGNTYEKEAIEKYMEAAGENATSPLTGEKLESRNLETNWAMRKAIYDAGTKVLARKK